MAKININRDIASLSTDKLLCRFLDDISDDGFVLETLQYEICRRTGLLNSYLHCDASEVSSVVFYASVMLFFQYVLHHLNDILQDKEV